MTAQEFSKLKIGDICQITRYYNAGRECEVVYIDKEYGTVCVRSTDGKPFESPKQVNRRLMLIDWRVLQIIKKIES